MVSIPVSVAKEPAVIAIAFGPGFTVPMSFEPSQFKSIVTILRWSAEGPQSPVHVPLRGLDEADGFVTAASPPDIVSCGAHAHKLTRHKNTLIAQMDRMNLLSTLFNCELPAIPGFQLEADTLTLTWPPTPR